MTDGTNGALTPEHFIDVSREWFSGAATNVRRDRLTAVRVDGANNFKFLFPTSLIDDNAIDQAFAGDDGDGDWLIATRIEDQANDVRGEDFIDLINNV